MRLILLVLLLACSPFPARAQFDSDHQANQEDATRMMQLASVVHAYSYKHNGQMPTDLAAMLDVFANEPGAADRNQIIKDHFFAPEIAAPAIPADAKPDWVNSNSSYVYLGGPDIEINDVPQWGDVAIAYLKLDTGHPTPVTPANPEGRWYTFTFMDGHGAMLDKAHAQWTIDHSRQILDAVRTGAPFPDDLQAIWNLQTITAALTAYAKDHRGELPNDLGSALLYVPTDKKRLATPQLRAAIFLSAAARKNTHIPDAPDADWVNHNSSYIYLAAAPADAKPLLLSKIEDPNRTILLQGRLDAGFEVLKPDQPAQTLFPISTVGRGAFAQDREFVDIMTAESKQVLDSARNGTPLPPYQATVRDLRLLFKAISAYQSDHNGQYPPQLGDTLPYLPDDELPTLADKAKVYLSPKAERHELPDSLSPEWINANTNYAYLIKDGAGDKPITRADLKGRGDPILLHSPLQESFDIRLFCAGGGCRLDVVAMVTVTGENCDGPVEWIPTKIDESKEFFRAARNGTLIMKDGFPQVKKPPPPR